MMVLRKGLSETSMVAMYTLSLPAVIWVLHAMHERKKTWRIIVFGGDFANLSPSQRPIADHRPGGRSAGT